MKENKYKIAWLVIALLFIVIYAMSNRYITENSGKAYFDKWTQTVYKSHLDKSLEY